MKSEHPGVKAKLLSAVLVLAILGYVSFRVLDSLFDSMDYDQIGLKTSPDSRFVVTELRSNSEGAHAPYGQHLVLGPRAVTHPDQAHVIFAGYCDDLQYQWVGPETIKVECATGERDPVRSLSSSAYGVAVEYSVSHNKAKQAGM